MVWQVRLKKQTLYSATVTDHLLNTVLDDFAVVLVAFSRKTWKKRSWTATSFFSPLPTHLARPEKTFYLCQKKELSGITITSEEF
jgi:hypothetical protein